MSKRGDEYSTDGVEVSPPPRVPVVKALCPLEDQRGPQELGRGLVVQKCAFEQFLAARVKFHGLHHPWLVIPGRQGVITGW